MIFLCAIFPVSLDVRHVSVLCISLYIHGEKTLEDILEKILTLLHLVASILLIQKEKALISLVYIEKK